MRQRQHQPCPDCDSSDALTEYEDHTYCFACGKYTKKNKSEVNKEELFDKMKEAKASQVRVLPVDKTKFKALTDRGISLKTAAFYNVWVSESNERIYPLYDLSCQNHVANQSQTSGQKGFLVFGDYSKTALFGQQLFPAGSAKQITVTEGFNDAMAAYEMTGSKYPVVAVKSASSAAKEVVDNWEYLNSFENIVICFDSDSPGQEAAEKVASKFQLGKVRMLKLKKAKDANDYLKNGWAKEFTEEWWKAEQWTPTEIRLAKNLWDEVKPSLIKETAEYPWDGLNQLTYGMRLSEVVLIKADFGVGKTSVVKEIEHHLLSTSSRGVGILHLEESNRDTLLGLMSITANRPLHLPDVIEQIDEEELRKYFVTTCDNDRIVIWNHFGSNSVYGVLTTIRHMVALGCKYIVLDHLSIVVSDQSGDERKQLDEISTKIKTLCMELDVCVICVIHINRQGQVRGSAGPEQIANIVLSLQRDKLAEDEEVRNTTKVTVEKNRFCGRTGPACLLRYDAKTGRLNEIPKEEFIEYLKTKQKDDDEW
jgi:twinkle protein